MSEGVWAVTNMDYSEHVDKVFATEVEALRVVNSQGYGRAVFLPFGKSLTEI